MALTCASLALDVQALCGRTDDAVLVTTARVAEWLNEAQREIAQKIPGLHALTFKNTTSLDTTAVLAYSLSDITAGDYTTQVIGDVWNVFYLDGNDSQCLHFVHTDEFDANWPDPTDSDSVFGKPHHWTRRANNIEMRPVCSSGYYDKDLRFDGWFYPRDFTGGDSTQCSDLSCADHLLKEYALGKAWEAIGEADGVAGALLQAEKHQARYRDALDQYESRNNRLDAWDGDIFSSNIE